MVTKDIPINVITNQTYPKMNIDKLLSSSSQPWNDVQEKKNHDENDNSLISRDEERKMKRDEMLVNEDRRLERDEISVNSNRIQITRNAKKIEENKPVDFFHQKNENHQNTIRHGMDKIDNQLIGSNENLVSKISEKITYQNISPRWSHNEEASLSIDEDNRREKREKISETGFFEIGGLTKHID